MLQEVLADPKSWQSLIAGSFAVIAAVIGGAFILLQIGETRKLESKRRLATFDAVRSTSPLLLSSLISWVDDTIATIKTLYAEAEGNLIPKEKRGVDWPTIDGETISELRVLIEYCDDKRLRVQLANITQRIQLTIARLDTWSPDKPGNLIVVKETLSHRILELLEIRCRIECLYPFARFECRKPPRKIDWERIESNSMLLHLDEIDHIGFRDMMGQYIDLMRLNDRNYLERASAKFKSIFYSDRS